jgi:O-antigen/teichoic acid export membrane protein
LLKKLFRESFIYGLSRYVSKFIGVFLLPLYTSVLVPQDYGILDLLGTILVVSSFLIISGTDSALSYYYFRKEHFNDRPIMISSSLWLRIGFSFIASFIIIVLAPYISFLLFGKDLSLFVIITALTLIFSNIYSFLMDLLRFELRPWLYSIYSTGGVLLNILLTIYFVLILRQGVYGALLAGSIAYAILFISTCIYVFRKYGIGFSPKWVKDITKYGFPLIGTGIAVWVLGSTDRYFLAHFQGLDTNGIYAVGKKMAEAIGMIAGALQLAWGPFALGIQYDPNAKKIYAKVFQLFSIINIVAVFGISMFAIDILKLLTQPEYYSAMIVVPFLCLSTVLASAYFIVVVGIYITKKLQHTIWITVAAAALNILLNFLLTPTYGAIGASFSIMTANFLIFLLTMLISQKHYRIDFNFGTILTILFPAAAIVAITYMFGLKLQARLIISVVFLGGIGIYLYNIFKNSDDFKNLVSKVKSLLRKEEAKSSEP